ncbi:MAG: DUF4277 domain-containing protein [Chloroflexi bacterium]|nr:DUF4277 domain-containing protein [Chloroflexota bacterium]
MPEFTISVERLDDLPLLYGFIEKMGIQSTIDTVIKPHGNWQGLSMGWVVSIWLSHIISVYNHRMDRVQEWVATHQVSLRQLTGQNVTELDFTDDRLAICLRELHEPDQWRRIESLLGNRLLRGLRPAVGQETPCGWMAQPPGCITTRQVTRCFRWGRTKKGL